MIYGYLLYESNYNDNVEKGSELYNTRKKQLAEAISICKQVIQKYRKLYPTGYELKVDSDDKEDFYTYPEESSMIEIRLITGDCAEMKGFDPNLPVPEINEKFCIIMDLLINDLNKLAKSSKTLNGDFYLDGDKLEFDIFFRIEY